MKDAVREYFRVEVHYYGAKHVLQTYAGEYRSLMALIYDKVYIEDFGECKGVGRCGTCLIHVLNDEGRLSKREGNEPTTLAKMNVIDPRSRLACHIMIDSRIDGLHFKLI